MLEMTTKITTEIFIQRATEKHEGKYDYTKTVYVNSKNKVIIICPKYFEFLQEAGAHLAGRGCNQCAVETKIDNMRNINLCNTEQFIEKAKRKHGDKYDYSLTVYVGALKQLTIICPIHGPFQQKASYHLSRGCKKCSYEQQSIIKKSTADEFIEKAIVKHDKLYDYSKVVYIGAYTHIVIICDKYGQFCQTPSNHLAGRGCPSCAREKISEASKLTTEEFIEKANKVHNFLYDYSRTFYIHSHMKVIIICKIHGLYLQNASKHIQGHGCKLCGYEKISEALRLTTEEFIEIANKVHKFLYDYKKVIYNKTHD